MAYMREGWLLSALQGESPVRSPKQAKVVQIRARLPVPTDGVAGYWKETAPVPRETESWVRSKG